MIRNKKKLVSIIMPVYNAEKFLHTSIESILKQTYKNFEFIIINDGSTDNSKKIIQNYLIDRRIKFYSLKKKGIVACLNYALKKSHGNYIARMDADDISLPDRIKKQVNFLNHNRGHHLVGSQAKYIGEINFFFKLVHFSSNDCKASIIFKNPFIHSSIMVRKKTITSLGGYLNFFKSEDYELWSRLLKKHKGANLHENLIKYRIHLNQYGSDNKNKELAIKNIQKKWLLKLGISKLNKKMNIHYKLSTFSERFKFDKNLKNYDKYLSWLLNLKKSNNKNLFNKKSFNKMIYMYYLGITILFAGHGLIIYKKYKNSEIYKKKIIVDLLILFFCYFKVINYKVKKSFWYIIQLTINYLK